MRTATRKQRLQRRLLLAGVLLVAAVLLWWYLYPEHKPAWVGDVIPVADTAHTVVYRWQDDAGVWQLSSEPPQDRDYETVRLRHDQNTLPAPDQE